jgi:hypothetical protein
MKRISLLLTGLLLASSSGCALLAATQDVFDRSLLGQALGRSTVIPNSRLCSYPGPYGPMGPGVSESHSPPPELLAPPRPVQNGPLAKPVPYNP